MLFQSQNIPGRPFLTSAWSGAHHGEAGGGQGRARRGCEDDKNVLIIHGKSLEVHLTILLSPSGCCAPPIPPENPNKIIENPLMWSAWAGTRS